MSEEMTIESYLAEGGKLTSPANVPPRYRAELLKLMATFVDSELAGAAGFADTINAGPGIKERIAAAKIVLEKTDNAGKVLKLMGEFGADTDRYVNHHPWTARLDRDADIGASRSEHDMRLAVFNYPLQGWADAVMMNLLMGLAVNEQLAEFQTVSYQPLAEAFRAIAPIEARHAELGREGAAKLADQGRSDDLQTSADYWWPRVAQSFGGTDPRRSEALQAMGLRKMPTGDLRERWERNAAKVLEELGLARP
ncbi:1,2-phenylacetyl-CoA epoxidase, catalytic subunit [Cribrihabitans marinus]|uniref:1,2-phenylacetyl-CoA epoxidase, catalytic subunit n=1 Tax=Cribrihabitans marinus TaxID=1227549 RepID=A0A1H6S977_9RHOB|nr:Phenylacetic acid catabolic protein [Cribrihabitans marinus]GGH23902.1 ring-oxidation complex protein 1 in the phenylacetic acid catabolism pathway [Cribrihabitans marinus]SEI63356.1 1,2-phenylacetyl-CoA epoxidase, catalytic subunit [Cribrihabitans marinus]